MLTDETIRHLTLTHQNTYTGRGLNPWPPE